jgi:shikimate kinase
MYILTQLLIAMSITLIGFMGCGKSTIGHLLSQRINKKFIDLDEYISAKQQMKLSEIFKKMGEDAFREIEHICLKEVLKEEYAVISLGGGTPCFFNNMDLITQASFSIYIKMDADVLAKRLLFKIKINRNYVHSSKPL